MATVFSTLGFLLGANSLEMPLLAFSPQEHPFCCTAFTVLSSFTALVTQDELIYSFLCVR